MGCAGNKAKPPQPLASNNNTTSKPPVQAPSNVPNANPPAGIPQDKNGIAPNIPQNQAPSGVENINPGKEANQANAGSAISDVKKPSGV